MSRRLGLIRWVAAVVYATAIVGALVIPHGHGWFGDDCCSSGTCHADAVTPSRSPVQPRSCSSHNHVAKGCSHLQASTCSSEKSPTCCGEKSQTPASTPVEPKHEDCPYCRFLAQAVQLATSPIVLTVGEFVTTAPTPPAAIGAPLASSAPLARGPPAC